MSKKLCSQQIDELLPQTQCGLCGYGGCMPYAEAIAFKNETINLCPPGGVNTLLKLAALTQQSAENYLDDMAAKAKSATIVKIRENECIGCTKCIQACPVDAIIGTSKQMHTILTDLCTGCDLCIPPCPVDCIEIVPVNELDEIAKKQKADLSRQRYLAKQNRIAQKNIPCEESEITKTKELQQPISSRQNAIEEILLRVKQKKGTV